MLIAVVGLNGSGKDTVAKIIVDKFGFTTVSISDIIRREVAARGLDSTLRDNMNFVAEGERKKHGPDVWIKKALNNYSSKDKIVLSSFRHPSEINIVKEKGGVVILCDANLETRFNRTVQRVKDNPALHGSTTLEDFKRTERIELSNPDKNKMQMGQCVKMFDYKIDNNSTLEKLYSQVDSLMKMIMQQ